MHKLFSTLFSMLCITLMIQAQPEIQKERRALIGLDLGYNSFSVLDKSSSPLIQHGDLLKLQLLFRRETPQYFLNIALSGSAGPYFSARFPNRTMRFREEDVFGNTADTSLSIRGLLLLPTFSAQFLSKPSALQTDKWEVMAGGGLHFQLPFPIYPLFAGLASIGDLYANGGVRYRINERNSFYGNLQIPLLLVMTRFPYYNTPVQPESDTFGSFYRLGTRLTSIHEVQSVRANLSYEFNTRGRVSWGVNWEGEWLRDSYGHFYSFGKNQLSLRFAYKI